MENILVSCCLFGTACRYDGRSVEKPEVIALKEKYHLVPFCPEIYGGLTTPRDPSERRGDGVYTNMGADVTAQYKKGAEEALRLCRMFDIKLAILKEDSPSCGYGRIHNGLFDGGYVEGNGVTAELLSNNGIRVVGEKHLEQLLELRFTY